jgi:hypothetical protein
MSDLIERLEARAGKVCPTGVGPALWEEIKAALARIKELDAANQRLRKAIADSCDEQRYEHLQSCDRAREAEMRAGKAEAERDAIEAAMIKRCKEAVLHCASLDENGYICTKDIAIKAIGALKT